MRENRPALAFICFRLVLVAADRGHPSGELQEALLEHGLPAVAPDNGRVEGDTVECGRNRLARDALRRCLLLERRKPGVRAAGVAIERRAASAGPASTAPATKAASRAPRECPLRLIAAAPDRVCPNVPPDRTASRWRGRAVTAWLYTHHKTPVIGKPGWFRYGR